MLKDIIIKSITEELQTKIEESVSEDITALVTTNIDSNPQMESMKKKMQANKDMMEAMKKKMACDDEMYEAMKDDPSKKDMCEAMKKKMDSDKNIMEAMENDDKEMNESLLEAAKCKSDALEEATKIEEAKDKENAKSDVGIKDDMKMESIEIDASILAEAIESIEVSLTEDEKKGLTEGIDLSEDLKNTLVGLFEAAMKSRMKAHMEAVGKKMQYNFQKKMKESNDLLEKKSKVFMQDVAKKFMKENQIQLESNIRLQLAESFMDGLKNLFEEHYFEVPEAKTDLVEALHNKINLLESKYSAKTVEIQALKESMEVESRKTALKESVKDLSDMQAEKVIKLMEGLVFETQNEFISKLTQLKESVMQNKEVVITEAVKEVVKVSPVDSNADLIKAMKQTVSK